MGPELSERLNTDWVTPQFNQKVKRKIPFGGGEGYQKKA